MTVLLVNLLAKMDLVSKIVSKRGKLVDIGWSLVILTFLLTDASLAILAMVLIQHASVSKPFLFY